MISRAKLKEYAKLRGLNLAEAEKDYFQNLILFAISRTHARELIFKGGTALAKCYGSKRFSEDLDFTCGSKFELDKIERILQRFGLKFKTEKKDEERSIKISFRFEGPLYADSLRSLCRVIMDVSLREKVLLEPEIKTLGRFMEEIPEFDVYVMKEEEILAEKIRAIMTRNKARDVYDVWFLLRKGVKVHDKLVKEKLAYYNIRWNKKRFKESVQEKRTIWEAEMKALLKEIPKFEEVASFIMERV